MGKGKPVTIEVGTKINHLTYLGDAGMNKHGQRLVNLRCDCGKEFTGLRGRFLSGAQKSCGCIRKPHIALSIGTKKNHLTYMGDAGKDKSGNLLIRVRCDCGKEIEMRRNKFIRGEKYSCGCMRKDRMEIQPGTRHDYLTFIEEVGHDESGQRLVKVRCDCGKIFTMTMSCFAAGAQKSCGCMSRQLIGEKNKIHGMTKTPIYGVWARMKSRCTNPNNRRWKDYGGRGIKVCDRWMESFDNFYEDMGGSYEEGLSLDRIDVDGDYCAENCRWVTVAEQNRNKRTNKYVDTPLGRMLQADAVRASGLSKATFMNRVEKNWPVVHLFDPPKQCGYAVTKKKNTEQ